MYKINGLDFKNKNEIILWMRNILYNPHLIDDNIDTIIEIFSYHPNWTSKSKDMTHFSIASDKWSVNPCFYINYKNLCKDDISFMKAINHIPVPPKCGKSNYIIPFGKYKGKSIYDVDDKNYIIWLSNLEGLKRGDKVAINQYLKWGYIPYNPVAKKIKSK